ncbi:hypothetical protein pb186bvf_000504 [Paramecium bursaria]
MQIRNYSFFKDFFKDHNMQYDLDSIYHFCTKLQLEVFTKGQPVLREGTLSNNKMYLIVVGKILVTSRNIQYPLEKQKSVKKLANMSPKKSQSKLQVSDDPFYDTLQLKFGQVINELGQGSYFGERALLIEQQKAALRSASCIAYTDSYLLTLERQDFLEVLKQFKKDSQEKKDILTKCIPKFESIASTLIMENLMYSFKEEYKNIHDYITIQGQEADQFYILCNGEVAITKHYNDHQLLLSITSSFEVLGEESLFCDQYKYSIQALQQDTKLLKISAGSLLLRSPKVCINEIRKLMQQKELLRERQLHNILKQNDVQTLKNSEVEINQEQIMKTQIMYAQQQNTLISMQRSLTDRKCAEAIQKFAKESYPFIYSIQEMRDSLKQKKIHTNRTYKLTSKTDLKSTVSIQGIQELKKNLEKENRAQSINLLLTKQTPSYSRKIIYYYVQAQINNHSKLYKQFQIINYNIEEEIQNQTIKNSL